MKKITSIVIIFLLLNSCSQSLRFIGKHHSKEVTIYRDNWGVPHIYGKKDTDVTFGLAYAHAEDDLDNIVFSILASRGKLGEYFGKDLAPNDYLVQLFDLWGNLKKNYSELDNETINICNAYADGINHYLLKNQPNNVPKEVYPVKGEDLIAGFMHKTPFFYGLNKVLSQVMADKYPQKTKMYSYFPDVYGESMGSNVFAVSPTRSENGHTLFMSNTHQPWEGPTAWYETHLHSEEGWNTVGGLFPGSPVILVGHNENLGWSHTVNNPDLIDVYELDLAKDNPLKYKVDGKWIELEEIPISFKVKLLGPIKITVNKKGYRSIFGPIFESVSGKKYAIRFQGMDDVRVIEQWYKMNKASNFNEWESAMSMMAIPSFNTGYADKDGNIFYVYNAKFPIRSPGYNWRGVLPGNTSETLWKGNITFAELPQIKNPNSGLIQNCNSSPFQTTDGNDNPNESQFPEWLGIETIMTNRALRSLELFGSDEYISSDDMMNYKYDLKYSEKSNLAKIIKRTNEITTDNPLLISAIRVLQKWDLKTNIDNHHTAFAIFSLFKFIEDNPSYINLNELEENILLNAKKFKKWYGGLEIPWGKVNRLIRGNINLPLNGGPDISHAIYGAPQKNGILKGVAGDCFIIYAEWDKDGNVSSNSIHQYGSTQNIDSKHFNDQATLFSQKKMKPVLFKLDEIQKNAERIYQP
jgi:acyl-homoserine-lactone acylase